MTQVVFARKRICRYGETLTTEDYIDRFNIIWLQQKISDAGFKYSFRDDGDENLYREYFVTFDNDVEAIEFKLRYL